NYKISAKRGFSSFIPCFRKTCINSRSSPFFKIFCKSRKRAFCSAYVCLNLVVIVFRLQVPAGAERIPQHGIRSGAERPAIVRHPTKEVTYLGIGGTGRHLAPCRHNLVITVTEYS